MGRRRVGVGILQFACRRLRRPYVDRIAETLQKPVSWMNGGDALIMLFVLVAFVSALYWGMAGIMRLWDWMKWKCVNR